MNELQTAVCRYAITGIKTQQLDSFISQKSDFFQFVKESKVSGNLVYLYELLVLYELLDKIQRERELLKEFNELKQKYPQVVLLAQELDRERHIDEEKATDILKCRIEELHPACLKYFNIRSGSEKTISLTHFGKKLVEYCKKSSEVVI